MIGKIMMFAFAAVLLCGCHTAPELPDDKGDSEAARWLRLAAEEGNLYAQYYYAECCLSGDGVPKDRDEAVRVLKLAAASGSVEARELLEQLAVEK